MNFAAGGSSIRIMALAARFIPIGKMNSEQKVTKDAKKPKAYAHETRMGGSSGSSSMTASAVWHSPQ
jgi:hypothetical protein